MKPPRKVPRIRKVHYGHYDSEFGLPHPVIRLGGKYLEEYGFAVGAGFEVSFEPGLITIRLSSIQEDSRNGNQQEVQTRKSCVA
ncbi:MAG: hypothetical protein ABSF91_11495 [Bacteroidota bacterium]|jgi:hypothetical protein